MRRVVAFTIGRGTLKWALVTEQSPAGGGRARNGATYYTLVEFVNEYLTAEYSRTGVRLLVVYYVNGTMIQAYGLDPDEIIPAGLKQPKVWFRMPGYMGFLTHPCVTSDAIPFRPSLLDAPPSRQAFASAAIGDPPDRDGAYVAGGTKCDEQLKILSWEPWVEGDPYSLSDSGQEADAQNYVQLQPPPYNFFTAPADEEPFTFMRVLMISDRVCPAAAAALAGVHRRSAGVQSLTRHDIRYM